MALFSVPTGNEGNSTMTDSSIAPQKVLIDGQVYILRNGKTYTPTGAEVE